MRMFRGSILPCLDISILCQNVIFCPIFDKKIIMRLSHFRQYYSNCHMIYYTIFNFQTTAVYVKKWSPVLYQSHQPRSRPLSIKWPESFDDFTIDNLDVVILQLVYQYIYGAFSRFCICVWTFCGGHSSPPPPPSILHGNPTSKNSARGKKQFFCNFNRKTASIL